jgi:hypothetical protein
MRTLSSTMTSGAGRCGPLSIVLRRQWNFAKAMRYVNHETENPGNDKQVVVMYNNS